MGLIEQCMGEKIHTRNISIAIYACGDSGIVVEGTLKDERLISHFRTASETLPPGTVHHMTIRMRIEDPSLTLAEIAVDMPTIPHGDCIGLKHSLEGLVGLRIAPGFTSRVKKTVGGVKGCVHLTTLLLAMAPAAVQGYWTHRGGTPTVEDIPVEALEQYLIDTCRVWRRNGPLAKEIMPGTR